MLDGSVAVRGVGRSLSLLGISLAVATAGELLGIRVAGILRHHRRPQVGKLPVMLPVAWSTAVAPAYGLAQGALGGGGEARWRPRRPSWRRRPIWPTIPMGWPGATGNQQQRRPAFPTSGGRTGSPGRPRATTRLAADRRDGGAARRAGARGGGARRRRTQSLTAHLTVAARGCCRRAMRTALGAADDTHAGRAGRGGRGVAREPPGRSERGIISKSVARTSGPARRCRPCPGCAQRRSGRQGRR